MKLLNTVDHEIGFLGRHKPIECLLEYPESHKHKTCCNKRINTNFCPTESAEARRGQVGHGKKRRGRRDYLLKRIFLHQ